MLQLTIEDISRYLTKDVLERKFQLKTKSSDRVKSLEVSRAAPAGEGLISAVYRITIVGYEHQAKFIAKGLVKDLLLRKSLNCSVYFKREALFFTTVLPILSELQESCGATERIQDYLPLYYGCHIDDNDDYIILEDMGETNCVSMPCIPTNRERDLTLKTLAHLHAVSLTLRIKKPEEFTKLANDLVEVYYTDVNKAWYSKYLQHAIDIYRTVVVELEDPESIYYKKFNDVANSDVYGQLIELCSTSGQHPVFNHGDAWFPNFLLSKTKAVAIDFQICKCGSPALDLSYFLLLCSHLCCTKKDFVDATHVYYKSLEYYLKDMGIESEKVFSYEMLQEELKKYGKYGVLTSLSSLVLIASERCDVMQTLQLKDPGSERIPLEEIWRLSSIEDEDRKTSLINAVHVAVDVGLI